MASGSKSRGLLQFSPQLEEMERFASSVIGKKSTTARHA
jgi:hypothetical protein